MASSLRGGEPPMRITASTLLVMSAFQPLTNQGPGASISSLRFGGFLLGGSIEAVVPRGYGLIPIAVPALALGVLASSLWDGRAIEWLRVALFGLAFLITAAMLLALTGVRFGRVGMGGWLAVGGSLLGVMAGLATRDWRRT